MVDLQQSYARLLGQTWLPDGEVIGIKPFWCISEFERTILCGIANFWHEGE